MNQPVLSLESYVASNHGLVRVRNLILLYDQAKSTGQDSKDAPVSDILRSAVVLLHAVLEEYVRHVVGSALPLAEDTVLDRVPITGQSRGSKFQLGSLASHRGKTVDQLLDESVQYYLANRSFNSISEIVATLRSCGIDLGSRIPAKALEEMISRRHKIVHEADVPANRRPSSFAPRAISRRQMVRWTAAVERFVRSVDAEWKAGRWSRWGGTA